MLMEINLVKFDIYQGTKELQIVLRITKIFDVLIFFQENLLPYISTTVTLSDATLLLPDLKKIIFRPDAVT